MNPEFLVTVQVQIGLLPGQALTGPVARGDVESVQRHLEALADAPPDVGRAYRALAGRALDLARERDLSAESVDRLRRLIEEQGS